MEDSSSDPDWETFQSKLMNAKAGHKGKVGKGPRYAVYDFQYELEGGEGTRYAELLSERRWGGGAGLIKAQEQDCLHLMESR